MGGGRALVLRLRKSPDRARIRSREYIKVENSIHLEQFKSSLLRRSGYFYQGLKPQDQWEQFKPSLLRRGGYLYQGLETARPVRVFSLSPEVTIFILMSECEVTCFYITGKRKSLSISSSGESGAGRRRWLSFLVIPSNLQDSGAKAARRRAYHHSARAATNHRKGLEPGEEVGCGGALRSLGGGPEDQVAEPVFLVDNDVSRGQERGEAEEGDRIEEGSGRQEGLSRQTKLLVILTNEDEFLAVAEDLEGPAG